jgi:hypothetical protein
VFKERGEDFLTIDWADTFSSTQLEAERRVTSNEKRFLIIGSRVDANGEKLAVLQQEVFRNDHTDGIRLDSLQPDTTYEIRCASWQRNPITGHEGWGEFSAPLTTHTLQSVVLQVLDLGEDFAQLSWKRSLRMDHASTKSAGQPWADLKYEIIVGCLDTGDDNVMHREVLDTTYTIHNLLPDTNYLISVRACDEKEQWGLWCRTALRTMAAVVASAHEIG